MMIAINLVGNGVVIDPVIFKKELDKLEEQHVDYRKSLLISRKAHIILTNPSLVGCCQLKHQKEKQKLVLP